MSRASLPGSLVHGIHFLSRVGDIETGTSSPMSVWMALGGPKKELKLEVRHEVVTKAS